MLNSNNMLMDGKLVLITGAARRIGKTLTLAVAKAGGNIIIHHGHSPEEAEATKAEIELLGRKAHILQADLNDPQQVETLIPQAMMFGNLFALVNNASIFETLDVTTTDLPAWQQHMMVNLTSPFILSKLFSEALDNEHEGRIINILDWRALRPGPDHLPYTISKAGLAALTRSLAIAFAPRISVNGIAFGAILPPSDGGFSTNILKDVPVKRWAKIDEVEETLLFLLSGPNYITGEIIHLDGGRHLI